MDREELEMWLEDKPREVSCAVASRAALRVAPIFTKEFVKNHKELNKLQIQFLRCYLISSLAAKMWSDDIESAALSAADSAALSADSAFSAAFSVALSAADSATSAAFSAAFSAADSAFSADSAALSADSAALSAEFEIWHEVELDVRFIEENGEESAGALVEQKLFHVEGNDWSAGDYEAVRKLGQVDGYAWWSNWLTQMHDGTFRNWDLAHKIALIEEKYWDEGAVAVAKEIDELRLNQIEKDTTVGEVIDFDEAEGKFRKTPVSFANDQSFLETLLRSVEDAVEDATQGNVLSLHSYEVRIVVRALERYRDDPQRLEMDFMRAGKSIARRVENGDLPDTAEVYEYGDTLLQVALDMRAYVPEVAASRDLRNERARAEWSDEKRGAYAVSKPFFEGFLDEALGEEFSEDIDEISGAAFVADGLSNEVKGTLCADPQDRISNRGIKFIREARRNPTARDSINQAFDEFRDTPEYKALDIGTKVAFGVGLIMKLILMTQ